jgi:hypothetical protein
MIKLCVVSGALLLVLSSMGCKHLQYKATPHDCSVGEYQHKADNFSFEDASCRGGASTTRSGI